MTTPKKLGIIASHPIQYYAPWFRYLSAAKDIELKVFYLWDFGVTQKRDQGFQHTLQWDVPLLEEYSYDFVPNVSQNPGTQDFWGLQNPELVARVAQYNPDAVLLMNYNHAALYRFMWQWRRTQIPILFRGDSHRLIPTQGVKPWARRQFIAQIYRCFQAFLYVGKANHEYFRYHKVPSEQLFFSPHAIDNDRFMASAETAQDQAIAWKQSLGIPNDHSVILFAGKFEPKKRPQDLLQAFVQANLQKVSLLLVGAGPLEQALKASASSHNHIYFAPFQNQSMMPRTYAAADLVVLPSYGVWETWGLAINEAMCLSRPIITSTHVGCTQDLVTPYENGLVFPAGDVEALGHCLQTAFSDRSRLKTWGIASRRIIAHYSYTQATQGLRRALDSVSSSPLHHDSLKPIKPPSH